jgi:hypothetical protein
MRPRSYRIATRRSAGFALSRLIFIVLVLAILSSASGTLSRCTQQAPQVAGELAAGAARTAGAAAGNAVKGAVGGLWDSLTDPIARAWDGMTDWIGGKAQSAADYWDRITPGEKFAVTCLATGAARTICSYLANIAKAGDTAQTERIACLWSAAGEVANSTQLVRIANACAGDPNNPTVRGTPDTLERCLIGQVQDLGGPVSDCLASSKERFFVQVRHSVNPVACPGGLTMEECLVHQIRQAIPGQHQLQTTPPQPSGRTDQNYLNCLTRFRSVTRNQLSDGCGNPNGSVTPQNAACVESRLLRLPNGPEYVATCGREPRG